MCVHITRRRFGVEKVIHKQLAEKKKIKKIYNSIGERGSRL